MGRAGAEVTWCSAGAGLASLDGKRVDGVGSSGAEEERVDLSLVSSASLALQCLYSV